jgi:protein-disulfide isomerase
MSRSRLLDRTLSILLTLTAVSLAGVLLRREFLPPTRADVAWPQFRAEWKELLTAGHWFGAADAAVVVVEFGDFECPYCKSLAAEMHDLLLEHSDSLALVYIHYPLKQVHRFAAPAALAAECAGDQGRFHEFHNVLFDKQDSLGLKSWRSYGRNAGITNLDAFEVCVTADIHQPEIDAGLDLGRRFGVAGTPAVIINGWFYPSGISPTELRRAIASLLDGNDPA